jgi:small subunit ribosomal protein S20
VKKEVKQMPIIKSSKKSVKTDKAQTVHNNFYTKTVKNAIKNTEKAIANKDAESAKTNLATTIKAIDKACSKGLIKKNTSARQKARLNKKVKEMAE